LEKTSKIIKPNRQPNTTMPAEPCPEVPHLHVYWTHPGLVTPPSFFWKYSVFLKPVLAQRQQGYNTWIIRVARVCWQSRPGRQPQPTPGAASCTGPASAACLTLLAQKSSPCSGGFSGPSHTPHTQVHVTTSSASVALRCGILSQVSATGN